MILSDDSCWPKVVSLKPSELRILSSLSYVDQTAVLSGKVNWESSICSFVSVIFYLVSPLSLSDDNDTSMAQLTGA